MLSRLPAIRLIHEPSGGTKIEIVPKQPPAISIHVRKATPRLRLQRRILDVLGERSVRVGDVEDQPPSAWIIECLPVEASEIGAHGVLHGGRDFAARRQLPQLERHQLLLQRDVVVISGDECFGAVLADRSRGDWRTDAINPDQRPDIDI